MNSIDQRVIAKNNSKGRLLRFLFNPPPLGPLPFREGGFAARLTKYPPDLVTHLGMVRSNAYYAAGCPMDLCDHAAARDLWLVIYQDIITDAGTPGNGTSGVIQGPAY